MELSNRQRKHLRGLGHALHPVVTVAGKGLSDAVMAEIETALEHHELIKVKLRADRAQRNAWTDAIAASTGALLVHRIGQVACFYRRNPESPVIDLPG